VIPKLGGTVSVLKEGLEAISKGGIIFITWVILISTVLGVFNLLPIPPLDGGLMLLSVVQMVAPKKYHRDIEVLFGYFGLVFVMFLFVIFVKSDGKIIKGLFSR
jgi:regulator of sigma E protease